MSYDGGPRRERGLQCPRRSALVAYGVQARDGPGCHAELLRGQCDADAVGRVRALIAARRQAHRSEADG